MMELNKQPFTCSYFLLFRFLFVVIICNSMRKKHLNFKDTYYIRALDNDNNNRLP